MRGKEEASDYRYFPEPDLLEVRISEETVKEFSKIPELPHQKEERYQEELGLSKYDAGVIASSKELASFFEEILKSGASTKNSVSWLTVELLGRLNKKSLEISESPVNSQKLSDLILAIDSKTISGKAGKDVLDYLFENEISVDVAIEKLGLKQVNDDSAILKIIDEVLSKNPDKLEQYRNGKDKLFGFFVGQVMKASKGSANPQKVNELLKGKL
jgi:aspartyl-tRNA(Asn)/glutamyl-tRNA(Gln) amidotransferase subunit B